MRALFAMGITGRDGLRLRDKWEDGPRTYLGLTTHGYPNLFVITGPQSPSVRLMLSRHQAPAGVRG